MPPSVAVVIPCYRQGRFLPAAIESVLTQTVPAAELIVVDDGSDDDTADVARRFGEVRLIRQENGGLASARNAGLRAAGADKVIFLDADDGLLPDAVGLGLEAFSRHPDCGFVYGGFRELRDGRSIERFEAARSHEDLIRCNWVASIASAMFDREKVLRLGGFDETLGMCEDWDLFLRLARQHPFATHPGKVALYVRHKTNMSNDIGLLKHWIDVVRDKERERGLNAEQQVAWDQGREIWASFYPERSATGGIRGALKRIARFARRPWRR